MFRRIRTRLLPCALAAFAATSAWAQSAQALTLKQAFDAAWGRQPEAVSQEARRDAAEAGRHAAASWSAAPLSIEVLTRTDRLNANGGQREIEAGIVVPLWLPGERSRAGQLAEAALNASNTKVQAAQLKLAATVRDAWWAFQRAALDHDVARDRLDNAQQLSADVSRRVRAGDLSRADQFQADSAVAQAEAGMAETTAGQRSAQLVLRSLLGIVDLPAVASAPVAAEPAPAVAADLREVDSRHPALAELLARADLSRRTAELVAVQTRATPELLVAATRERGQFGDVYRHSVTVGVRVPFGGGSRNDARRASARADAMEAQSQAALEQARLRSDIEAAQLRVASSRLQRDAAEKRLRLAREVRGFFEKSFRLGESDLPTRLRVEHEAAEAERQSARTRIEAAAAISALRQALGHLPE